MESESYKNFLKDIINEIFNKYQNNTFEKGSDLQKGYDFAIYEIISLFIEQSEIFGLSKKEIGLENIDAERDFL